MDRRELSCSKRARDDGWVRVATEKEESAGLGFGERLGGLFGGLS
jgi:hypothetical protein